jgi:tetratricopeptide (TPR) repeat protein
MGTRVGIALLLCAALASGSEAEAHAFWKAFQKEDEQGMRTALARSGDAPFMAQVLLLHHCLATNAGHDSRLLECARALAKLAGDEKLIAMTAAWRADATVPETWNGVAEAIALRGQGKLAESDALLDRIEPKAKAYPASLLTALVAAERRKNRVAAGDDQAALAAAETMAAECARVGWVKQQIEALFCVGEAALKLGRHDEAVAAHKRELAAARTYSDLRAAGALVNLGNCLRKTAKYAEAEACYREALPLLEKKQRTWAANALLGLGQTYRQLGKDDEALAFFERCRTFREEPDVLREIGRLHHDHGRFGPADKAYRRGFELAKETKAQFLFLRGLLLNDQERFVEAIPVHEEAVRMYMRQRDVVRATEAKAHLSLALYYGGQRPRARRLEKAVIKSFERLGRTYDMAAMSYNLGLAALDMGDYARAVSMFERASGHRYDNPALLVKLGEAYWRAYEFDKARATLEQALAERREAGDDALVAYVLQRLGEFVNETEGDLDGAIVFLKKSLAIRERLGQGVADSCNSLAFAHRRAGRYLGALAWARRELDASGPRARTRPLTMLGRVEFDMGREEKARRYFEQAVADARRNPHRGDLAEAMRLLGSACIGVDNARARELIEESIAIRDDLDEPILARSARLALTGVLLDEKRFAEALELATRLRVECRSTGRRADAMVALVAQVAALNGLGRMDDVISLAGEAVREAGDARFIPMQIIATKLSAQALHARGRRHEALDTARRLVKLRNRHDWARGAVESDHIAEGRHDAASLHLLTLHAVATQEPDAWPGLAEESFAAAESARSLFFLDKLLLRDVAVEAGRVHDARQAVARAQQYLVSAVADGQRSAVAEANEALTKAYRDLNATEQELEVAKRRRAPLLRSTPVALDELHAALAPDTTLLLYHFTDKRLLALVVGKETSRLVDLAAAEDVRRRVAAYVRLAAQGGSSDKVLAAKLDDLLLRPLVLPTTRVLVAPYGSMAFLPFETLVRDG